MSERKEQRMGGGAMLEVADVEPLLRAADGDEVPSVRLACLSTITHLPLSTGGWRAVGPSVRRLLEETAPGTPERRAVIQIAARAPLASVRADLRRIAGDEGDPDGAEARRVLREPSRADVWTLLDRVAGNPPDAGAAEALAALPIETFDVDDRVLWNAARGADGDVGLWAALALARRDEYAPLDRILAGEAGEGYELSGDPWSAYERLAALRPIPEQLRARLLAWLDAHPEQDRHPNLIAWALTGARDAEGYPIEEPPAEPERAVTEALEGLDDRVLEQLFVNERLTVDEVDRDAWQSLTGDQARTVIVETVRTIADQVGTWDEAESPWRAIDTGNELVHLTSMLPGGVDLPVPELYWLHTTRLRSNIADSQMAWVLSRAEPAKVVAGFMDAMPGLAPQERVDALDMLARIGDFQRGAPAPILGAGPSAGTVRMGRDVSESVIVAGDSTPGVISFESPPPFDDMPLARSAPPGPPAYSTMPEPEAAPPPSSTAWPHLVAPVAVVVGESFPVEVGLAERRDPTVHGTGILTVPVADYTLDVELLIDGFETDASRTFSLDVSTRDRYPKRTVHLVAIAEDGLAERRRIGVVYRIGNEMRGYAGREVVVKDTAEQASAVEAPPQARLPGGIDITPFAAAGAADLTLVIQLGAAADESRLLWSAVSPHMPIPVPPKAPESNLGSSPEQFLKELVDEASTTPDAFDLFTSLEGRGKAQIARHIPSSVRDALRRVAEKVNGPPTVLLVSQDPYVPWELAVLEPPLPGTPAGGSPFLGAQAVVGRWVLQSEPPPPIDPPREVAVRNTALVTGVYEGVLDWERLESAESEVAELERSWPDARRVDATLPTVLKCLKGDPEVDIIHFALHGAFNVEDARQGLVLIGQVQDDSDQKAAVFLKPSHVDSGRLSSRQPFVFLNACQVGAGRRVLGDNSGMASAFIRIGASGVVAPLWSVDDKVASEVALDFYQATLREGKAPAEALRSGRAKVTDAAVSAGEPQASCTRLAYQFFGHPNMRLARLPTTRGGSR